MEKIAFAMKAIIMHILSCPVTIFDMISIIRDRATDLREFINIALILIYL